MVTSKVIVLIVSIIMPQEQPDVNHVMRMKSFETCWTAARDFTERDLTEDLREHGALGFKATCGYQEMKSEQD